MHSAKDREGKLVYAQSVQKGAGPFTCPLCSAPMYLTREGGNVPAFHHYHAASHVQESIYVQTELFIEQVSMMDTLEAALKAHPMVVDVQRDREVHDIVVPLSFVWRNRFLLAIDDARKYTVNDIYARTITYSTHKPNPIHVLWTAPFPTEIIDGGTYTPDLWELFLHGLYYGRVMYWKEDATLLAVHFDGAEQGDPTQSWPRTVRIEEAVSLFSLHPQWRQEYQTPLFTFPACALWLRRFHSTTKTPVLARFV